jgi:hypothetical protein
MLQIFCQFASMWKYIGRKVVFGPATVKIQVIFFIYYVETHKKENEVWVKSVTGQNTCNLD